MKTSETIISMQQKKEAYAVGEIMATQSILKNIVINDPADAETFVCAMEKAADAAEHSHMHTVESEDLSGESLQNFMRTIMKK